ncbi:MAG TPA: MaoC family dehydratase [Anaerolineae bacterium]
MRSSLQIGQLHQVRRIFSQADFDRFAALSGDYNPIHVDPGYAAQTAFGRPVAHGMFLYSVICAELNQLLPGVIQLEQEMMFTSPTYAGEEVVIQLRVTGVWPAEAFAELETAIIKPDGTRGFEGRTVVRLDQAPASSRQLTVSAPIGAAKSDSFKGLAVGQRAETRRTFTEADLAAYASLTGDTNPIYSDVTAAQRAGFARPVVPGGLLGGLFSQVLGTKLPGPGTNWLKQRLAFPAWAYPGEAITAAVEIIRLRPEKALVNLRTTCTNPAGETVCAGEALVLAKNAVPQGIM